MKKISLEITAIVLLSLFLGILYNNFAAKPMKLIAHNAEKISDNFLDSIAKQVPVQQTTVTVTKESPKEITTNKTEPSKIIAETKPTEKTIVKTSTTPVEQLDKSNIEKTLTIEQVKKSLNDPRFFLIDARNNDDFAKGHIGNAINIFPYEAEVKYMERIYSLPRDKIFIIYCNGGTCDLSHKVADDMLAVGFKNIFIFTGGWDEWSKSK